MTARDQRDFTAMMTAVFSIYDREINEGMIGYYFNALIDFPLSSVKEAFMQHTNDPDRGQFWPKPADVVRHISGGKGTQALAAWDEALRGVREVGYYGTVTFADWLILVVIDRMGGWMAFCSMDEDDKPFKQREFIERYTAYLSRPPANIPASLPGYHEATNAMSGYRTPQALEAAKPVLPGEKRPVRVALPPVTYGAILPLLAENPTQSGMSSLRESLERAQGKEAAAR